MILRARRQYPQHPPLALSEYSTESSESAYQVRIEGPFVFFLKESSALFVEASISH
jgi:hypothetical protein